MEIGDMGADEHRELIDGLLELEGEVRKTIEAMKGAERQVLDRDLHSRSWEVLKGELKSQHTYQGLTFFYRLKTAVEEANFIIAEMDDLGTRVKVSVDQCGPGKIEYTTESKGNLGGCEHMWNVGSKVLSDREGIKVKIDRKLAEELLENEGVCATEGQGGNTLDLWMQIQEKWPDLCEGWPIEDLFASRADSVLGEA